MSLDLYLEAPPCETCGYQTGCLKFNITYNLSKMWYELYPDSKEMLPIEDMTGAESLKILETAIDDLIQNKAKLLTLEPPNGWGTFQGFIDTLRCMRNNCEDYPDWIWSTWR